MAELIVLTEVEWHRIDDGYPSYRACDFCYQSVTDDIYSGKKEEDWRRFYLLPDGCCCCENCIPEVEA